MALTGLLEKHPRRVIAALVAAGLLIVVLTLTSGETAVPTSRRSGLLILGCWMLIAAVLVSPGSRAVGALDLRAMLSRCIGEVAFGVAFVSALLIVCFGDSKNCERLGYFMTALVVVPAAVAVARRFGAIESDRRERIDQFLPLLVTVLAVCVTRLSGWTHLSIKLLIILLALRAATEGALLVPGLGAGVRRACDRGRAGVARRLGDAGPWLLLGTVALLIAALPFLPGVDLHPGRIAIALGAAIVAGLLFSRSWRSAGVLRRGIDVVAVLAVGLGVLELHLPDLVAVLNQNYFLGPANDVMHGRAVLVGTFSQYGLGMFDVLAGFFAIFPLGYGVLSLLIAILTALLFVAIYAIVRLSTRSQLVAVLAVAFGGTLYAYGQPDFYTAFPSTGVLRFGPPWLIVLLAVWAAHTASDTVRRRLEVATLVLVGIASVWSGESGVYCLGTAAVIALLDAFVADAGFAARVRDALRRLALLVGVYVAGIALFSVATRIGSGDWPHWGTYIDFVRLYTTGGLGAEDISPWSPGIALGAAYAVSAAVLIVLVIARPEIVRARLVAFRAAAGITALGTLVFTYFLGRANPINLIHISPPGVALVCVWVGIVLSATGPGARAVRSVVVGSLVCLGALISVAQHANLDQRFGESALGVLVEHPGDFGSDFSALAGNPPVTGSAVTIENLVRRLPVGSRQVTILALGTVESEAVIRLGIANAGSSTQPCQENLSQTAPERARARVLALRAGSILVVGNGPAYRPLVPIDSYALKLITARFYVRHLASTPDGVDAYMLTAQRPSWNGGGSITPPPFAPVATIGCG